MVPQVGMVECFARTPLGLSHLYKVVYAPGVYCLLYRLKKSTEQLDKVRDSESTLRTQLQYFQEVNCTIDTHMYMYTVYVIQFS